MASRAAVACGAVTKHSLMLSGRPTEVLCVGQGLQEAPQHLVLFIPGNPGVASYYKRTMEHLYSLMGGSHSVWAVSHAGHCVNLPSLWPGNQHIYNLEEQIQHKITFLETHIPAGTKLTLVGHSIGCKIILRLLQHFENHPSISITQSYLLFPTIERMKVSPNGVKLWPVLKYLRWFVVMLVCVVCILPGKILDALLRLYFGSSTYECCVDATKELLNPRVVQNMLWMARDELEKVVDLDVDVLRRHRDKVVLYYGASDAWCPVQYWEGVREQVPGVRAELCDRGTPHAFVLRYAEPIAEKVAHWMGS
ncbi:lipid droplet-associated hydrolase-like isoform X2 [Portunus trituberculatus]|nr:lipid droplet-associated hydrolase-like isoform X2 [Portunus trituberculatus]XP_045116961.1 lipid droplet-associated hydrolase-like isoform X2 [Portunus trituberculatus]